MKEDILHPVNPRFILDKYPLYNLNEHDLHILLNMLNKINSHIYRDEIFNIIESHGLNNNPKDLENLLLKLSNSSSYPYDYQKYINVLLAKYDKSKSLEERLKIVYETFKFNTKNDFNYLYTLVFNEKEQHSYELASIIIEKYPKLTARAINYINKQDRFRLISTYYQKAYTFGRNKLTEQELDLVISKIRETDEIFLSRDTDRYNSGIEALMVRWKSDLLNKLKKIYGKSYVEKTHKSLDNDDEFIYILLNSNVLESIYTKSVFTVNDTTIIKAILAYFEECGKDVTNLREKDKLIRQKYSMEENSLETNIIKLKDDDEALENYLKSKKIKKDNFVKYISTRKFLDKQLKTSIILILSKHYNINYISVYDILDMIAEAQERNKKLNEILKERNIDIEYFNKVYKKLKKEQPEIYELIKASKINKTTKALLRYYYSIINDNINNYDEFVKKYKQTPEELLERFANTDLQEKVYEKILTWYDFRNGLPEFKNNKRH